LKKKLKKKFIDVTQPIWSWGCPTCMCKNSLKTQKCIFCLFLSLRWTVYQPYRLSHINTLRINQSYEPEDQSIKVLRKKFEKWRFWKTPFFWVGHFEFFFWIFFCFASSHENQSKLLGYQGWVEILMIPLVYSKRISVRNNLSHSVSVIWSSQASRKVLSIEIVHSWR
jgi:hypothetical protein